jgi:predicted permease
LTWLVQFHDQFGQIVRRLARAPLFTVVTLMTLAVSIGANTVVFSVVDGVLLEPLGYPYPDRLIAFTHDGKGLGPKGAGIAPYLYFIDREQSRSLEDIGAYHQDGGDITGIGQPEHVPVMYVTDGTLSILGVKPRLGRLFNQRDDSFNAPKTVLLSYGYWQRRLGGIDSAVGRSITVDGAPREIIGVLPGDFHFLNETRIDLFLPFQWDRSTTVLGNFIGLSLARLKPGVSIAQATADLERLVPVANHSFPAPNGFSTSDLEDMKLRPRLYPLKDEVIGDAANGLWVLMASIFLLLLVACANITNLLLVRMESRRQELAIRSALGAGRLSVITDLLLESLFLGLAGGLAGLGLAVIGLRILIATAPSGLPRLHDIGIRLPVMFFTLGVALFVSLFLGMIPALRYSGVSMSSGLREGGRALSQGRERHRTRKLLVIIQVSLALVLLICSGLMIRTFRELARFNLGFAEPAGLQTFEVNIPASKIPETDREQVVRMEQAVRDKLASIPGVRSVAISTVVPLFGENYLDPVFAEDHSYTAGELPATGSYIFISPEFFGTAGTTILAGRNLTWNETYEKRPVALVSEIFAREYWGKPAAAIGKRIRATNADDWREVVGVAQNVYYNGTVRPPEMAVYLPLLQARFDGEKEMVSRTVTFVIRSQRAGSGALLNDIAKAVWSVNADLALADPTTIGELFAKSMARTSFTMVVVCVAGSMALLLGIIGIYGVISYSVSQRTREIGIRLALGEPKESLTAMFVRQGLTLAGIGAAAGLGAAFLVMRLMESLLFRVSPFDPWTYGLATICVLAIAWVASYLPALRATVVNPVHALRAE